MTSSILPFGVGSNYNILKSLIFCRLKQMWKCDQPFEMVIEFDRIDRKFFKKHIKISQNFSSSYDLLFFFKKKGFSCNSFILYENRKFKTVQVSPWWIFMVSIAYVSLFIKSETNKQILYFLLIDNYHISYQIWYKFCPLRLKLDIVIMQGRNISNKIL